MDDFGTGYSSLSNLRSFPFDRIKIDGSFIKVGRHQPPGSRDRARGAGPGPRPRLSVVAEGVETADELSFLAQENCTSAQGYLLGRPAPIERFAAHTHGAQVQGAQLQGAQPGRTAAVA